MHARIEEHGLHIWLGFYENAFRLIRRCYAELNRPPGSTLATWREAFAASAQLGGYQRAIPAVIGHRENVAVGAIPDLQRPLLHDRNMVRRHLSLR